jgi:hypothetical protein
MDRHGLSSPVPTVGQAPTGELSPMAILVGVTFQRLSPVTPTRCVQRLGPAVEFADRMRWPVQTADASPSPLMRIEGAPSMQGEAKRRARDYLKTAAG